MQEPNTGASTSNQMTIELAQRIVQRQTAALEEVIKIESGRVTNLVYRIIEGSGDIKDAEEITSDVFYSVWTNINKYDPSRANFRTWINLLAVTAARDFRRAKERHQRIIASYLQEQQRELLELLGSQSTPREHLKRKEVQQAIEEAIAALPKEQRRVFNLRYGEDLFVKEISKQTGKAPGTVKSTLHKARERVRETLQRKLDL